MNQNEKTPSFHMNDRGFFDHSTDVGGGPIELIQLVMRGRNEVLNCYEAGRWLLDHGLSSCVNYDPPSGVQKPPLPPLVEGSEDRKIKKTENTPIRQNLVPAFRQIGTHPEFVRRGIGKETCEYLGCGYLETSKSALANRIVFQIRGVVRGAEGELQRVIYSHIGRALTEDQIAVDGKWWMYNGFSKTLELFNIDNLLLDPEARRQLEEQKRIILVEGAFDVAKLVEANMRNVVASFGAHLDACQVERLKLIATETGVNKVLVLYDRDKAGQAGTKKAKDLLEAAGFKVQAFNWKRKFSSNARGKIGIPDNIGDVCEFSVGQLNWLRQQKVI